MSFFKFLPFRTYFGPFFTLFWPLVIFGVKFLQIVICAFINCVNMPKNALINGISMGIFNFYNFFYLFWTFFDPFLTLVIFGVKFLQIFICAYINCVNMPKIVLINSISMGIFNFYHFLTNFGPFFDPFLVFGYIQGQIPIVCQMRIYKFCIHAKNCTHKWYFYGNF